MLTVDPLIRATTIDILHNTWFQVDLPEYLFAPVTKKISCANVNGNAIKEASEVRIFLGINQLGLLNFYSGLKHGTLSEKLLI